MYNVFDKHFFVSTLNISDFKNWMFSLVAGRQGRVPMGRTADNDRTYGKCSAPWKAPFMCCLEFSEPKGKENARITLVLWIVCSY